MKKKLPNDFFLAINGFRFTHRPSPRYATVEFGDDKRNIIVTINYIYTVMIAIRRVGSYDFVH